MMPAGSQPGASARFLATANIASHLPRMAASRPHKRAVVVPAGSDREGRTRWVHYTFQELDEASNRLAWGLSSIGVGKGTRTVLMVPPSLEMFALVFALFKVGAVLVMIDPGMPRRSLSQCLREAEPEAFIGVPLAHLARPLLGSALRSVRTWITVGSRWLWGGYLARDLGASAGPGTFPLLRPAPGDMAAILFTSGSTGVPKGAIYTHGMFDAQVRALKRMHRFEADEIDLATFPLFALFDPALGMTAVIPEMDARRPGRADPAKIVAAIQGHGCTNMFASPALLRNLGRFGQETGLRLPSLRRVLSAGEAARRETLEQVSEMLTGNAEVFTPYGATEALPVADIGSYEVLGETWPMTAQGKGICVGLPVPGVEVRIIRIDDGPVEEWSDELLLPAGEVGEITVRGPMVSPAYQARPEQTALAKIREGDGVVHRMGDVGYLDQRGRLWMCGRKSQRVRTAQGPLFTVQVERIFDEHPAVRHTALVGVGPRDDQRAVLLVEREGGFNRLSDAELLDQLREIRSRYAWGPTKLLREIIVYPDHFPVDVRHNAKIGREALAVWAQARLGA